MRRRLTLLDAIRRRAKGRPLGEQAKKRRPWQGLTVGGLGPKEYGRLYARAHAAAFRQRPTGRDGPTAERARQQTPEERRTPRRQGAP